MKNTEAPLYAGPLRLRTFILFSLLVLLSLPASVVAQEFYVSPVGKATGDGSPGNPWDLQTALHQPRSVVPGSTIYLQEGTYRGNFTSLLTGTAAKPIVVKSQPGKKVLLDGYLQKAENGTVLTVQGAYTWFWGLEVFSSNPQRTLPNTGSDAQGTRGEGFTIIGQGIRVINCLIHDNMNGIGGWAAAADNEYYGNLVYNNGWVAQDRYHGHGVYSQNNTGTKSFGDNIIANNLSYGVHVYGSATAPLNNYSFDGNVLYNGRWLVGGIGPANNISANSNYTYANSIEFGYGATTNNNLVLTNNIFSNTVQIKYWNNMTVTGNTVYDGSEYNSAFYFIFTSTPNNSRYHFNNNTYYWSKPAPPAKWQEPFVAWSNPTLSADNPARTGVYLLSKWKQMGMDANASVTYFPQKNKEEMALSGTQVLVRKNKYEAGRANIVVYNYSLNNTVQADVSQILSPGDSYELHNTADYQNDVLRGVYTGGHLTIPMTGHSVETPVGLSVRAEANTFPAFGTFVLVKTSETSNPLPSFRFLGFEAVRQDATVLLRWNTEGEQGVKQYTVERSADGVNFTNASTVKPSSTPGTYQYSDGPVAPGTYTYRIREVAENGQSVLSSTQQVVIPQAPFRFTGFTASLQNGSVVLTWSTEGDQSSKNFVIDRAPDGVSYTSLTTIAAPGNAQSANTYTFTDQSPAPAFYTYRIKRVANDGSLLYSGIQQLSVTQTTPVKAGFDFTIAQNPVVNELRLNFNLPTSQYLPLKFEIKDAAGRVLYSTQGSYLGNFVQSLPVTNLLKGNYTITVTAPSGAVSKAFTVAGGFDFTIAQNPVVNELRLNFNLPTSQYLPLKFEIKDAAGRVLYSTQGSYLGSFVQSLPVTNLLKGDYTITVTTPNGAVTKAFNLAGGFDFTLVQNPVSSALQLSFTLSSAQFTPVRFDIVDLSGQVRFSTQATFVGAASYSLPVSGLPSGTYYVHLNLPAGSVSKQFLKL